MAVKRKPFGGYTINFKAVADVPLGKVFGTKPITPSEMTKLIWKFVKQKKISNK